jgi:hypothetical protein
MSYITAKKCFKENCQMTNPRQDPVTWNLNNGLLNLASGLQHDLAVLQQTLNAILRVLKRQQ